jgi:hypothetical protein
MKAGRGVLLGFLSKIFYLYLLGLTYTDSLSYDFTFQ